MSTSPLRRSKNRKAQVNIFRLFDATSTTVYTIDNLTPRSAEACCITGILPEEVRSRDLAAFADIGVSEHVQKMRFEDYVNTRMQLQEELTQAREDCDKKNRNMQIEDNNICGADKSESSAGTFAERETKQLKLIRARQRKEVEQMLAYEMKQVELSESSNRRLESDRKRFESMKKIKQQRLKQQAKQRQLADLAKRATREVEERYRRKQVQQMARRDKEAAKMKEKQEQEREIEAEKRNQIRQQKVTDLREIAEMKQTVREKELLKKRANLARQEEERTQQLQQQQEIMQAALAQRRKEAERRVEKNAQRIKRVIRKQDNQMRRKNRLVEARQLRAKAEIMAEKDQYTLENEMREKRRELILADTREHKEERIAQLIEKAESNDILDHVRSKMEMELAEKREIAAIKRGRKAKNMQRRARKEEYESRIMHEQQDRALARVEAIAEEKEQLLKRRMELRINNRRAKDDILTTMDKIRVQKNWAGAEKLLLTKL